MTPLTHAGNGVFTGEAAVPVEENGSLTVTLLADTGGTVTREQAEFVYQLSDLLPVTDGATGTSAPYWEEGTLLLNGAGSPSAPMTGTTTMWRSGTRSSGCTATES